MGFCWRPIEQTLPHHGGEAVDVGQNDGKWAATKGGACRSLSLYGRGDDVVAKAWGGDGILINLRRVYVGCV